jgi:hypothetical protein
MRSRVLARNPNPALERNPTVRQPKPPLQSSDFKGANALMG